LGALFSGGKDSTYALYLSLQQGFDVPCLITLEPLTPESYMFHHPNIELTRMQAAAMEIPIISKQTSGQKEEELKDLAEALGEARSIHGLDGVISGAIDSDYQKSRIDRITYEAGLKSFAPLWRKNPAQLLQDQHLAGFEAIICGVYARGLDKTWLGRPFNQETNESLVKLSKRFGIHPSGEGGEYESLVLNAPIFHQELHIDQASEDWNATTQTGTYEVLRAHLQPKAKSQVPSPEEAR
jgi:diphthine-ammonia ligase